MSLRVLGSTQAGRTTESANRRRGQYGLLRRKLLGKLLLAYLTPLFILAIYFHYNYERTLRKGIENHLVAVAEYQRNTVDLFLEERIANTRSIFRSELFSRLPPAESLDSALGELRRESPTFVDIGLFDAEGIMLSYAGEFESLLGKDYSGEPWFQGIRAGERSSLLSDVYQGFRHQPHFIIAVRREVQERPWILRTSVDPVKFAEFLRGSAIGEEGESFIVNRAGQRQTLVRGDAPGSGLSRVPDPGDDVALYLSEEGGVEHLSAVAWLRLNDWALVVRVPSARAFAPIGRARLMIVGILTLAAGLIVVLVFGNTARIVRQLQKADADRDEMQDQLFGAAKLASVGEMAAGVAHEINNPLAIIHEEAGMMLDCLDPEFRQELDLDDFRERLGEIHAATMRGRSITGKLLAFSRRHDSTPEPLDLNEVIRRTLAMKEVEFRVSNIEIVTRLEHGLPLILANENQLEQVFLNLLNNARDAMPRGGRITVQAATDEQEIRLDFIDRGSGMSDEVMQRIFFPFFTTKDVGKGTGLGLSISYGIVKSHGGRIEVESEPGRGTRFTIRLPIPAREAKRPQPQGSHER